MCGGQKLFSRRADRKSAAARTIPRLFTSPAARRALLGMAAVATSAVASQLPHKVELPADQKPHHPAPGSSTFRNPWPSFTPHGTADFFRLFFGGEWDRERSKPPPEELRVPVIKPDFNLIRSFASGDAKGRIAATWLGHAAFLVQMGGLSVLADPCCSERCSPSQWVGPARIRPMPCGLEWVEKSPYAIRRVD